MVDQELTWNEFEFEGNDMINSEFRLFLSLYPEKFKKKPWEGDIKKISKFIASHPVEISPIDFEHAVTSGQTFVPAQFTNGRKLNEFWRLSNVFSIDIDNKEGSIFLHPTVALERCITYGIEPLLMYHSFSSTEQFPRYRIIFALDGILMGGNLYKHVLGALVTVLPECDKASKKISQMYFGGLSRIHFKPTAILSLGDIAEAYRSYKYQTDRSHASGDSRTWCSKINSLLFPGTDITASIHASSCFAHEDASPLYRRIFPHYFENSAISVRNSAPLYIYKECQFDSRNQGQNEITADKSAAIECQSSLNLPSMMENFHGMNVKIGSFNGEATERSEINASKKLNKVIEFNFQPLHDRCALWRKFQESNIEHDQMVHLAICLSYVRNGESEFFKYFKSPLKKKINDFKVIFRSEHQNPTSCETFCPEANTCVHPKNIIGIGRKRRHGTVQDLQIPIEWKDIEVAELELYHWIDEVVEDARNDVFVLKAPTGLGKSEAILKKAKLKTAIIAVPNHRLKKDLYTRARNKKLDVKQTPELPELPDHVMAILNRLYRADPQQAGAYKRQLAKEFPAMKRYFKQMQACIEHEGMLITTHEMMLRLRGISPDRPIIIDEDITQTLITHGDCSITELRQLADYVKSNIDSADGDALIEIINDIVGADLYTFTPAAFNFNKREDIEKAISRRSYESDLLGFLNCTHFTINNNLTMFITKRSIPHPSKLILIDATADETFLSAAFDDRTLHFKDIGPVRPTGELIQYCRRGVSRETLKHKSLLPQRIEEICNKALVITYKKFKNHFKKILDDVHFGQCVGIDSHSGKNIAVVGTPHINMLSYGLYACALGIQFTADDFKTFGTTDVVRNGYQFKIRTFLTNKELQHLQLHIIESNLVQAVGRNRILRQPCTAWVFSNLPLLGAEIKDDMKLSASSCRIK